MGAINFFGIVLILVLFASCDNQSNSNVQTNETAKEENMKSPNVKTDLEVLGLKGNVNVLKQEEFYGSNNGSVIGLKTGSNSFSYKFDENGTKTEEQYYDSIGMLKDKSEYIYSNEGKKTGKKIKDLDNNLLSFYQYEYDELDRIVKINITDYVGNEKYKYYSTTKYDESGNEILSITFTPEGQKVQSAEYKFENNKKIKLILYDNMDSPYAICEYKYNDKDDVIKEIYYTGNNLLFEEYSMEYTYDTQNNWIKKVYFLDKIHMNSSGNANRILGVQTITMRTITYK